MGDIIGPKVQSIHFTISASLTTKGGEHFLFLLIVFTRYFQPAYPPRPDNAFDLKLRSVGATLVFFPDGE